jgi:hypothetical protein
LGLHGCRQYAGSCLRCGALTSKSPRKNTSTSERRFRFHKEAFQVMPLCRVPKQLVLYRSANIGPESMMDPRKSLSQVADVSSDSIISALDWSCSRHSMAEKPRNPEVQEKEERHESSDDDDVLDSKERKSNSDEEQSRRAPLPLAHRGTLCFYRVITSLLLMMWIYLTPDSTSAFSCLIGRSEDSSCMSLLRKSPFRLC